MKPELLDRPERRADRRIDWTVFAIHRRSDLHLLLASPQPTDVSPTDRLRRYENAGELLTDVQSLADTPGGILYVVYAYRNENPPPWLFARDFGAQEAANVFAQARAWTKAPL